MPGWNQLPLSLIPIACKHTSMVVLLLYTLVFQQSASQAQLWASKAENMSDSSFTGPREHLFYLAPNTQKCWTSLEFKTLAPQKNLEQGNKIHSFSCCVSPYTRSLLLKSYFTMDTCSLFHKVQKRNKCMFSIKLQYSDQGFIHQNG